VHAYVQRRVLGVAAQLDFESKIVNQFISFQFQALNFWRFQHVFESVNLRCPTSKTTGWNVRLVHQDVAPHVQIESTT